MIIAPSRACSGANFGRRPIPAQNRSGEEVEEYVVNILVAPLKAVQLNQQAIQSESTSQAERRLLRRSPLQKEKQWVVTNRARRLEENVARDRLGSHGAALSGSERILISARAKEPRCVTDPGLIAA
jgi:hypothetical protein